MSKIIEKVQRQAERYDELQRMLSDPAVAADPKNLREYGRELSGLEELMQKYRRYRETETELAQAREMQREGDPEMGEFLRDEIASLETRQAILSEELRKLVLPKDPRDEKNVFMEIRAGTGGDEAALFAAELYRMYARYAESKGWKVELIEASEIGIGGYKEVVVLIRGKGVYSRLKYESGTHRVQRVPVTESSGRIHTSAATVAILPEVEDVDIEIKPEDIKMEVFHSSGAGGQNVQKTSTAVRIYHLPTGLVVACQDERSQIQNKLRAMSVLRARLFDMEQQKRESEERAARRSQVGSGDRSEKIRTYNYPQSRVTDHRINFDSYRLRAILEGELDEIIDALSDADQAKQLEELTG
jgi:peptide chain release factor 1